MTTNLKNLVEQSLTKDGWSPAKIESAVKFFDPGMTLGEFYSITSNMHLVQSRGFPSFKLMQASYDYAKVNIDQKKAKKARVPLSARYLLSLVKSNDSLMLNGTKETFVTALKAYMLPWTGDKAENNTNDVLRGIRSFGLLNAKFYMASEESPQLTSLQQLSTQSDDDCQHMDIPTKELERCIRVCKTNKAEVDLFRNSDFFQLTFNCNHCPTSISNPNDSLSTDLLRQYKDAEASGPGHGFLNKSFALFNANKAMPMDNLAAITKHMEEAHRKGEPFALSQTASHSMLLPCRFCTSDPSLRMHAFICCRSVINQKNMSIHPSAHWLVLSFLL